MSQHINLYSQKGCIGCKSCEGGAASIGRTTLLATIIICTAGFGALALPFAKKCQFCGHNTLMNKHAAPGTQAPVAPQQAPQPVINIIQPQVAQPFQPQYPQPLQAAPLAVQPQPQVPQAPQYPQSFPPQYPQSFPPQYPQQPVAPPQPQLAQPQFPQAAAPLAVPPQPYSPQQLPQQFPPAPQTPPTAQG